MIARLVNIQAKRDFEKLADEGIGMKIVRYMLHGMPYKKTFKKQKEYDELMEMSVDNPDLRILSIGGTDYPLQ